MKSTKIYFVCHAEANLHNENDRLRELTAKGDEDAKKVTRFLMTKEIDAVLSSPFRCAVQTVQNFAQTAFFPIVAIQDPLQDSLQAVLHQYDGKNIVIGTFKEAVTALLQELGDPSCVEKLGQMVMPQVVCMAFENEALRAAEVWDLNE